MNWLIKKLSLRVENAWQYTTKLCQIVNYLVQPNKRNLQTIPQTRQHHKLPPQPIKPPSKPPNIIKQVPLTIEQRLSNLSVNEQPFYEETLQRWGVNQAFSYNPTPSNDNHPNKKMKNHLVYYLLLDKNVFPLKKCQLCPAEKSFIAKLSRTRETFKQMKWDDIKMPPFQASARWQHCWLT